MRPIVLIAPLAAWLIGCAATGEPPALQDRCGGLVPFPELSGEKT